MFKTLRVDVLPGVTVTLTSRTQGNAPHGGDDEGGRFVFAIVRPDTYTLQAALQGFKTLERTNVVVNANDRITTGTLTMEVGQMTEEVSVTSRVTEVQSTSGERSFALESEALTNIASIVAAALQLDVARAGRGRRTARATQRSVRLAASR